MSGKLNDKVVLVTGGNGLLGRAIAERLQLDGAIVLNADIAVTTTADLSNIYCDITSEASVSQMLEQIVGKYGRIDAVVNNAYPRTKDWGTKFEQIPFASWQKNIDLQLNSYFLVSQQALHYMKSAKSGAIVNMSSIYGVVGPDFSVYNGTEMTMPAAYSAIKGALVNLTRYMASYFGPYNIRVNCVSPGGVFDHQPDSFVSNYEAKVPLRRMALPADIAPAVSFLLSGDASYITGQNLLIDGGWTCI
ncbi:oxidoreductase [uncultured Chitinophaga sp.]|uniref:oxidoreductase n=1 Tax=uncultured Chitinophaga sp. TaxID=339340 RepID=UPI002600FBCD|nr:oxidoreductase [uncultured Chitinophaga sp.]